MHGTRVTVILTDSAINMNQYDLCVIMHCIAKHKKHHRERLIQQTVACALKQYITYMDDS